MSERQSRHPDNDLIDEISQYDAPAQQSTSDGNVSTAVASRSELARATEPEHQESVVGSDNPAQDARKGSKTMAAIKSGNQH